MAWLQFGSVSPLSFFFLSLSSSMSFSFIAALCPTFSVCPLSLLFRVVVAPHGTLTVRLWANVDLACPSTVLGEAQLPRFCEIVIPLSWG